jgi:beta-lactamase class A
VCVLDVNGRAVDEVNANVVLPTASIGKVFLLCEAAEQVADGRLDPRQVLTRDPRLAVADSGLWQHLIQDELPLADVCVLIAAVSDNWATNTLLDLIGVDPVGERARLLGCAHSRLHDRVRDVRGPVDPSTLSTGTARELAEVARRIHVGAEGGAVPGIGRAAAQMVRSWLMGGVDLSMVAAPCHLDPLAHGDGRLLLWSKTGTDEGVRADMGVLWSGPDSVAYAAIATWDPREDQVGEAMQHMHALGAAIASRMW